MGKSLLVPPKVKHRIILGPSNSMSRHTHKRTESRDTHRDLYTNVQSSTVHNSQKAEITQVSTNRRTDRHIMEQYLDIKGMKV